MIASLKIWNPDEQPEQFTLRKFYEAEILPGLKRLQVSPRSISEDYSAIKHWEQCTRNRYLDEVTWEDLVALRDGLLAGRSGETVNKVGRELRAMFREATIQGRMETIPEIPSKHRMSRGRSVLVRHIPKLQRELVTETEFAVAFKQTGQATYPRAGEVSIADQWKVFLILLWYYGPRTLDALALQRENVSYKMRSIQFRAIKTGKLQTLPLLDVVARSLRRIESPSPAYFAGFKSPGCFLTKTETWKRGYRTSWRNEICRAAEVEFQFKNLRERTASVCNEIESGLGDWVLGHTVQSVTSRYYDLPTRRVRRAMESLPVPRCISEWLDL